MLKGAAGPLEIAVCLVEKGRSLAQTTAGVSVRALRRIPSAAVKRRADAPVPGVYDKGVMDSFAAVVSPPARAESPARRTRSHARESLWAP